MYPAQGYKKAFARPGAKSRKEGATERASRSPTLFREDIAKSSTIFKVRRRSDTSSIGSNRGLQRASSTTARSQGGTRDRTLGPEPHLTVEETCIQGVFAHWLSTHRGVVGIAATIGSPAPDVWPSILTDYTYDSELDITDGVPQSISMQLDVPGGEP